MLLAAVIFWGLVAVGNAALWLKFENSLHSTAMPPVLIRTLSALSLTAVFACPLAACWLMWSRPLESLPPQSWTGLPRGVQFYLAVTLAVALVPVPWWMVRQLRRRQSALLLSNHSSWVDLVEELGHRPVDQWYRSLSLHFPKNECFRLECNEKQITTPRLPAELDGLTIGHFSDLHLTGVLGRDFYRAVVERMVAMNADLVVLCGDLIDRRSHIDWLPELLAPLKPPHGAYFVLGNHDWKTGDSPRLRQALTSVGWIDLGGNARNLTIRGRRVFVAGNELPWYTPAAEVPRQWPAGEEPCLRIAVTHSPDQYAWAREQDFDVLLAGHMHGGQICAPWLGPLIAPSWLGVRYAAGTFYEAPTVLHVSRGVSGRNPYRLNCPPEITKLVLRAPKQ